MESNVVVDDLIEKWRTVNSLKKVKNKLRHHHVISMVCILIDQSSRPISAREILQLL